MKILISRYGTYALNELNTLMFSQDKFYLVNLQQLFDKVDTCFYHLLPKKYPHILQISSHFSLNNLCFSYHDIAFPLSHYHEMFLSRLS